MLVLTRKVDEKIVFPAIGVTVQLLRINGSVARIGIDAPPELKILREEVSSGMTGRPAAVGMSHELRNRLSKVTLGLHLFQKERDAGLLDQSERTLEGVLEQLESLDRQTKPPAAIGPTKKIRALLVEDDANERELLAGLLGMNGCECATAADGFEALEYLENHDRPDVVLLDMVMPRCDGPATLQAIRANKRWTDLPVFSVSGTRPQDLGVRTGPGGIDGWFPKPLNPRSLWAAVQHCTRN